jgi:hypothetical protein
LGVEFVWLFHGSFPSFFGDFRSVFLKKATMPFLSSQVFTQLMRYYPLKRKRGKDYRLPNSFSDIVGKGSPFSMALSIIVST